MKYLRNKKLLFHIVPIIILMIISVFDMYLNRSISKYKYYYIKQFIWYMISFGLFIVIIKKNIMINKKGSYLLYIINIILLLLVLVIGKEINGSKAWFDLKVMAFQPSELMKLSLILVLSRNKNIFINLLLVTIPSLLTFLEPDTGAVIIYFLIFIAISIINKKNNKIIIIFFSIIFLVIGLCFYLFFMQKELFFKIFGTSFLYRIDRIIDFKNNSGMQLTNSLINIGSGNIIGNKTFLYLPENLTDFIFANIAHNFGYVIASLIILIYLWISILFFYKFKKLNFFKKAFVIGFFAMYIFSVFQNIGMNLGLVPIMGITLPFLSYGGSSLLIHFILYGFLYNINNPKSYL